MNTIVESNNARKAARIEEMNTITRTFAETEADYITADEDGNPINGHIKINGMHRSNGGLRTAIEKELGKPVIVTGAVENRTSYRMSITDFMALAEIVEEEEE